MAHRLFHTIVLSSSLLCGGAVSGCAQSHETSGDGDRDAAVELPRDGGILVMPDSGPPDGGPPAMPDSGPYPLCEPGWPTTKAQVCEVGVDGSALCCRPVFVEDAGWVADDCCVGRREDVP